VLCTALSKVLVRDIFPSACWLSLAQFAVTTCLGQAVVRRLTGAAPDPLSARTNALGKGSTVRWDLWKLSFTFSFGMLALNKGYEHMHVSLVETL